MEKNIPERIFYVWLGGDKPADVRMAVYQWQQELPDYEIIELGSSPSPYFNLAEELKNNDWFRTVYRNKMWAYAADYIRCKVLYEHGGIYLGTDITILRRFDDLLKHPCFCGMQNRKEINMAVFGCRAGNAFVKKILDFYNEEIWQSPLFAIPDIATFVMKRDYGVRLPENDAPLICGDFVVYPRRYFYPLKIHGEFTPGCIVPESYTIHWWKESWCKSEIMSWLKSKHLGTRSENMRRGLFSRRRIYLFGFWHLFDYDSRDGIVRFWGVRIPFLSVRQVSGRIKVTLLGIIPLLKIR